jgi:hypothetical protein
MMRRIILVLIGGMIILLVAACSAPSPEPSAPEADSTTPSLPAHTATTGTTDAEPDHQQPAKPATVDFGTAAAGDDDKIEEEPMEAPAPGGRDPQTMLVEQARLALAERLGIAPDEITAGSVEAVTWPDTGLGCPDPEMMYLQVLTPGYRIVLSAGGNEYVYHTNRSDQIVLCGPDGHPVE